MIENWASSLPGVEDPEPVRARPTVLTTSIQISPRAAVLKRQARTTI